MNGPNVASVGVHHKGIAPEELRYGYAGDTNNNYIFW